MLADKFGRNINYLRIGVTDRCNLRCRYCMPEEGIDFSARKDILSYEEIIRSVEIFKELGVNKLRITGGEPFVRKDIGLLLERLSTIIPELHITTNATLLDDYIPLLREIRVASLNISIDSLDRDKFFLITRRDSFEKVMQNILACKEAGIEVKLNIVVMKGLNHMEIVDFIEFGKKQKITVRFIEAMPFNDSDGNKNLYMSSSDIHALIQETYPSIQQVDNAFSSSLKYNIEDDYSIGIIPAYSRSLCGSCNRIRLTPKGELLSCLYASEGLNLLELLRNSNINKDELKQYIKDEILTKKKSGTEYEKMEYGQVFHSMTTIGG